MTAPRLASRRSPPARAAGGPGRAVTRHDRRLSEAPGKYHSPSCRGRAAGRREAGLQDTTTPVNRHRPPRAHGPRPPPARSAESSSPRPKARAWPPPAAHGGAPRSPQPARPHSRQAERRPIGRGGRASPGRRGKNRALRPRPNLHHCVGNGRRACAVPGAGLGRGTASLPSPPPAGQEGRPVPPRSRDAGRRNGRWGEVGRDGAAEGTGGEARRDGTGRDRPGPPRRGQRAAPQGAEAGPRPPRCPRPCLPTDGGGSAPAQAAPPLLERAGRQRAGPAAAVDLLGGSAGGVGCGRLKPRLLHSFLAHLEHGH